MNLTDSIKTTKIGSGRKSLEQLQTILYRYCLSITGSTWDDDDLAQDTWLKGIGILEGLEHKNPEAFLLRIAKNTWIDQSRRKAVLVQILKREQPKVSLLDNGSFEIETMFQALMKHLSPLQRTVFLLRDVFGYSNAETAKMIETTEGAVKAALHRARHSLDAVRDDLEKGSLPLPEEEGLKTFPQVFAAAYQKGDIARLVELAQQDQLQPTMAIGAGQNRVLWNSLSGRRADTRFSARMVA